MASIVVGSVAVDVVPNATNFARDLRAQIEGPVDAIGQEVGQNLSDSVVSHLTDAIPEGLAGGVPEAAQLGDSAGARFGDAFSTQIRTKIDAALKSLPDARIDGDTTEVTAKIDAIREDLLSLNGFIDISGNEDEVLAQLADIRAELEQLSHESPDIRIRVDAADAEAKIAALIAQIYELDAAQQALAASMAADIEAEHALAATMAAEWDAVGAATQGAGMNVSAFAVILAGLALIAAPVLGVLIAGMADLVIGIKNAHANTADLKDEWHQLEAEAGRAIQPGLQVAVDGLAKALPELDPLVTTLGNDLGHVLGDIGQWLGNGGATKIVDYLKTEIPIVGGAFESLAGAVGGFIEATQGPANVLLKLLTGVLDTITAIEGLIGKGEGFVNQINRGGAPANPPLAGGPSTNNSWSWFGGGPSRTLAAIPKTLNEIGTLGGLLGSPSVPQKALTATQQPLPASVVRHGMGDIQGQGPQLNSEVLQQATGGLDDNSKALIANAAAAHETVAAYQGAANAAAQNAAQIAASTAAMVAENNAAGILSQALNSLGGNALGVAQTETQFHAAITAVNAGLKQNGTSLDENTAKGQANLSNIQAAIAGAQAHAQAIATQTGSTVQATAAYNQDIATLKQQLAATGLSKQAIDNYIDSIDKIKPLVMTQIDIDDAAALAAIADLNRQLSTLGRTATGIEVTSEAVLRRAAAADGMVLSFYADGGHENHVAQMAPAGAMRVWAEPETGGESYIPHAASKRQRSEAILSETAHLFGGAYVPRGARYAADGLIMHGSGGSGAGGASSMPGHSCTTIVQLDRKQLAKAVNEQNGQNRRL